MIMEQYYFVKPQYIKYYKEVIEGNIENMNNRLNENKDIIFNLAQSLEGKKDLIERLNKEIKTYKETKRDLLEQIKHLSKVNGEYRRERHDMEDKLIEATKPWYSKLFVWKSKLFKLSIRNPFFLES